VLYRSNVQARPFEEALRQERIEYRMIGGQAFYERKEVKDAIAYLKATLQPRDEISLRRVVNYPARGIGDGSLERCAAYAALHKVTLFEALRAGRSEEGTLFGGHGERPAVEGIPPKVREAIGGFVALLDGHREALEAKPGQTPRGLVTAARALLEAAGLPSDLRAAGPTAQAAQRRLENLEGFLRALERWEERSAAAPRTPSLTDYLHRLSLSSSDDDAGDDEDTGSVTLVTLHGAKGLEYRAVFLVGLEEELLPHKRTLTPTATDVSGSLQDMGGDGPAGEPAGAIDLSEERRLLYVGITRARERLYLSRCRSRGGRGERTERAKAPSRFLDEVPPELCEERDALGPPPGDAADEEAFARECLAKLRQMTSES
jgi:DNA helicase-2/ATP-dependent DNA helicase PcrA